MKREYAKLFSFILGITFILSGIIFAFVNSNKIAKGEKIKEENLIIDEILNIYDTFKTKTEDFSVKRDEYLDDITEYTSYYSGMAKNYSNMQNKILKYETLVKEVEDSATYLKSNCLNANYSKSEANSKCTAYIINYEKTVNSFVGDVEFLNNKIKEYNEWIKNENKKLNEKDKYKKLDEFEVKYYKDYIDINDDGIYLGKNKD